MRGSYLVGMIAAAMSKNGVIGTVGGVQNPVICDFITGYAEGARAYNPDIKVITSWVGELDGFGQDAGALFPAEQYLWSGCILPSGRWRQPGSL